MYNQRVASLTGNDTIVIGGRVINNLADGDVGELKFPNEIAAVKSGKNGNTIYALNATGFQVDLTLRVIRGSDDDNYLNGILAFQIQDFASFQLLDGQVVKRVGDGRGNVANDSYLMSGGVFVRQVDTASNVEGNTDQSVSIYNLRFGNGQRAVF